MHVYMAWILALLHQKYGFCRSVTMNARLSEQTQDEHLNARPSEVSQVWHMNARSSELELA